MAAHTALGFLLAIGVGRVSAENTGVVVATLVIWVIALNGGTLALNSAFDRDEGDIGYLDTPPPAPRRLAHVGLAIMLLGQAAALLLPLGFAIAYAVCFAMSVLYSAPPVRLKAVAGFDWAINMIGFGSLTPYAGWAATGRPLTAAAFWVFLAFCPLFAALYPLTQLYQMEEDAARGDRTLAIALGPRASLAVALAAVPLAFACFARAGALANPGRMGWTALGIALVSWLAVLVPWWRSYDRMSTARQKRGMYLALGAWAVTDVAVVLAFAR